LPKRAVFFQPLAGSAVFRDFRKMWEEGDLYQRKHLLGLVIEKVWVKGYEISAITLRPSYHLVVTGLKKAVEDGGVTAEGSQDGNDNEKEKTTRQLDRWLYGSDGILIGRWHTPCSGGYLGVAYAMPWGTRASAAELLVVMVSWGHNLSDLCLLISRRISSTNFFANWTPCSASCLDTKPAIS